METVKKIVLLAALLAVGMGKIQSGKLHDMIQDFESGSEEQARALEKLIDSSEKSELTSKNEDGLTPLQLALSQERSDVMAILLRKWAPFDSAIVELALERAYIEPLAVLIKQGRIILKPEQLSIIRKSWKYDQVGKLLMELLPLKKLNDVKDKEQFAEQVAFADRVTRELAQGFIVIDGANLWKLLAIRTMMRDVGGPVYKVLEGKKSRIFETGYDVMKFKGDKAENKEMLAKIVEKFMEVYFGPKFDKIPLDDPFLTEAENEFCLTFCTITPFKLWQTIRLEN